MTPVDDASMMNGTQPRPVGTNSSSTRRSRPPPSPAPARLIRRSAAPAYSETGSGRLPGMAWAVPLVDPLHEVRRGEPLAVELVQRRPVRVGQQPHDARHGQQVRRRWPIRYARPATWRTRWSGVAAATYAGGDDDHRARATARAARARTASSRPTRLVSSPIRPRPVMQGPAECQQRRRDHADHGRACAGTSAGPAGATRRGAARRRPPTSPAWRRPRPVTTARRPSARPTRSRRSSRPG